MEIEAVKTWQWMLAGLFVGFLFSCIVAWSGPTFDGQARDTIDQGEFENDTYALTKYGQFRGLAAEFHKDQPLLRDVTVHPPIAGDPRYWVTGRYYIAGIKPVDPSKIGGPSKVYEEWMPFKYAATAPYAPGYTVREEKKLDRGTSAATRYRNAELADLKKSLGGQDTFPTVTDYLKAVSKLPQNQNFKFQYAWWELRPAKWSLPPLAGFLMIGVAWPLALGVLQNFGMTKPVPVKKPAAHPAPKPAAPKAMKPVVPIQAAAPEPPKPSLPLDLRDYRGEFYPVAKSTHKE
jgi:hypothetical protein